MKDLFARRAGLIINIIYITTVAAILAAPSIGVKLEPDLFVDYRAAAKFPELSVKKIPAFPRRFEAWFNDRFCGRSNYIAMGNLLILRLFRESPNEQVILGSDGFFFLANHQGNKRNSLIWRYFKFGRRQVEANATAFISRLPILKRTPKKVLFMSVPTKHLLYFDKFPPYVKNEVPDPGRFFPTEVMREIIRRRPDAACFFTDLRSDAERIAPTVQLIPPANFHWLPGPYTRLAADVAARRLGLTGEVYVPKREEYRSLKIKSDLSHLVYRKLETDALLTPDAVFAEAGITTVPGAAKIVMPGVAVRSPVMATHSHYTFNSKLPSGRLLLIGDSFTNPLRLDMARYCREVVSVEYSALFNYDPVSAQEDLRQLIARWRPEYIVAISHFDVSLWGDFVADGLPPDDKKPRPLRWGENIFFADLDYYSARTEGVLPPEEQDNWATRKASLELQLPPGAKRHLRLTFAGKPIDTKQTVRIYDRRKRLLKTVLLAEEGQYGVDIPRSCITDDDKLILFFDFPNAGRVERGDARILSFFFRSLKLAPLETRQVLSPGIEVDFNDLDCYVSRTDGFCPPEAPGCWAGRKAFLELKLPRVASRHLRFAFTGRPVNAKQTVRVFDHRKRLLKTISLTEPGQYDVDIPRGSLAPDDKLILFFDFPDAARPEGGDARTLSFFFQSLKFTPLDTRLVLPPGIEVDFNDLDCYVSGTEGFCPPEQLGSWATRQASLELPLPQKANCRLRLSFTGRPVNAKQTVKVYDFRKRLLKAIPLTNPGRYDVDIPRGSLAPGDKLILFFDFPDAARPESGDARTLSFFFQSLKITPVDTRFMLPLGSEVDFNDLNSYISKTEGFCLPERLGTWAGRQSSLELQLTREADRPLRLTFTGRPVNAKQTVKVYDFRKRLLKTIPLAAPGQYGVDIPRGSLTADNRLILFFDFPNACRPDNGDERTLSFFFRLLKLSGAEE